MSLPLPVSDRKQPEEMDAVTYKIYRPFYSFQEYANCRGHKPEVGGFSIKHLELLYALTLSPTPTGERGGVRFCRLGSNFFFSGLSLSEGMPGTTNSPLLAR